MSTVKKPKRATRSEDLYEQLLGMIASTQLAPGERLPSERTLAAEQRLSREIVRQATTRLQAVGFVEVSQGRANRVANLLEPHLSLPLEGLDDLTFQLQVLEVRAFLEGECAWYCATRASKEELALLAEEYGRLYERGQRETTLARAKADLQFHTQIARYSHHLLLVSFSQIFYERYFNAIYGVLSRTLKKFGRYPEGIRGQHADIHRAIQARDAETARRVARDHILYTRGLLAAD
ncbi:FadR/GntR family transcriptional regulator [Marinobacterium lutimaris]|uniref:Transcriptional regulator, GntR family n=1 Tax=Marinobacterium lutimaris TaxID=568106 RepID=A0A1H6ATD1_9GAMM|nr:FCD domain-containing protein [Marinobacterium lutimaris]SEG51652.1 transcriptional regulator, GntR family [Marinobacterium lutimaris]